MVGGDAHGLADHTDTGGETTGHLGVLVGALRVVLLKRPAGRHQMAGDQVGEVEWEGAQFVPDVLVELVRRDVGSERGQFLPRPAPGLLALLGPLVTTVTRAGSAALGAESTVTIPEGTCPSILTAVAGTVVTVAVGTPLTTVIAVTTTGTIVTIERTPFTTIVAPLTGTLLTVERRSLAAVITTVAGAIVPVPGTVPATRLITITVRTPLTAIIAPLTGTLLTVERRSLTTVIAVERRSLAAVITTVAGAIVPVPGTVPATRLITITVRTPLTAIIAPLTGTLLTVEGTPLTTVITPLTRTLLTI
ncbi:hypothetical protein AB0D67_31840, partial [Streptosporangium sp. NPDC048047]|uniref:hypothetical protein n=1 Tax=Streptosporangium sp. NPDC048047 TaxID=3155748 RepID=UPI003429F3AA